MEKLMNFLPLKRKTEKNFIHLLSQAEAFEGLRILPGQAYGLEARITLPAIIVEASECQPDEELGDDAVGAVTLTASVVTDTRKDLDGAAADAMLAALNELLLDEDLPAIFEELEGLPEPDWLLYDCEFLGDDTSYDGDERRDILSFRVLCHELAAE
jgi:hypothetical protein